MFAVIFGRPECPYCVRAKELAEKLASERDDFKFVMSTFMPKAFPKLIWKKRSVNRLKPCHKSLLMKNTLAAVLISKPTPKNI